MPTRDRIAHSSVPSTLEAIGDGWTLSLLSALLEYLTHKTQHVVRAVPPQGAMYMMLDIRATGMSGNGFAEKLLDERRIAVMPGESFGAAAAGHVRVAMTVDDAAFEAAFAELVDFAAAQI